MSDRLPTDEDLNAYVDGELSAHDRARVAQAVAADPSLANRVAALAKLKSTVAGLGGRPSLTLDGLGLSPRRRRLPRARIAASILAILAIAVAAGGYWDTRDTAMDSWVAQARAQHAAWLGDGGSEAARDGYPGLLHKARQRLDLQAYIPDMSSAKLTLTDIAYVHTRDENAARSLQLRYTGQRGCRVSLWLSRGGAAGATEMTELNDGRSRGFYWQAGGLKYALFASGMDHNRLTLLARNVFEATRDNRLPPPDHERELRVATDTAAPCRA